MSCGERGNAAEIGHTPEPWRFNEAQADIDGPNGEAIAVCYWNDDDGEGALFNGRRIVACVNACAGMANEQLDNICMISGSLINRFGEQMHYLGQVEQQRDELLAALEALADMADELCRWDRRFDDVLDAADTAIARVKGHPA